MYKLKLNAGARGPVNSESGRVSIKVILWVVFIFAAGYGVYMVAPPYVSYKMLQYEVEGEAKVAHMYTNAELKDRILEKAGSWSVDIDRSDIEIIRDYEQIEIAVSYGVRLVFFGRHERDFFYEIYVREPLKAESDASADRRLRYA